VERLQRLENSLIDLMDIETGKQVKKSLKRGVRNKRNYA
jgi:hypothetical protein